MIKTGEEAVAWIHSRKKFGSRPGLTRVNHLLELLGNPEKQVKGIHVAGTNGKGSTVMYLRCLLAETGLTVGTFTSPYIESFYERIAVNGKPIPAEDFVQLVNQFMPLIEAMDQEERYQGITEFEILTAMAFVYFKDTVDLAIFEAGIGGLLDSTNVIQPLFTTITTIGLDHVDILGDTEEKIAQQKAGIIKPKVPMVTGNISKESLRKIEAVAKTNQAPLYRYGEEYQATYLYHEERNGEVFDFKNNQLTLHKLTTPLLGKHQIENAAVALQLFCLYCAKIQRPVEEAEIRKALMKVRWPARMEKISDHPTIIIDGAHNPHAVERLVVNIEEEFTQGEVYLLFSAITTKNIEGMLRRIQEVPNLHLAVTTFDYPNAVKMTDYQKASLGDTLTFYSDWRQGIKEITHKMTAKDTLFVTGSLYFVSQVREEFQVASSFA